MPLFLEDPVADADEVDSVSVATRNGSAKAADHEFATQYQAGLSKGVVSGIGGTLLATPINAVDTIAAALPGIEKGKVAGSFLNAIGGPGANGWYDSNKEGAEIVTGVAGILVANALANKVLAPGKLAMRTIQGLPGAKTIASLDRNVDRATRLARITMQESASRGAMGSSRFIGGEMSLNVLGAPVKTSPLAANRGVIRAKVAKGLAQSVTTEAIMAATLHENDFLYSDDLAHDIAWGVGGLAIGAGVDSMIATYSLRRLANSEAVRQLNAGAYDPTGYERQRINAYSTVDELLKAADGPPSGIGNMFRGGGGVTDQVTSLAVQSAELGKTRSLTERGRALFQNREKLATPLKSEATEILTKVHSRGIRGVPRTAFGGDAEGLAPVLRESLERSPTSMHGIEEIGTPVEGSTFDLTHARRTEVLGNRIRQLEDFQVNNGRWTRKSKTVNGHQVFEDRLIPLKDGEMELIVDELQELRRANSHQPVVMLEPGEWAPVQHGKMAESYQPKVMQRNGDAASGFVWERPKTPLNQQTMGIGSNGQVYLPSGVKAENLADNDSLDLFALGRDVASHHINESQVFTLPNNPTWFQIDLAEQIASKGSPELVQYSGTMTRELAQIESFAQKLDIVKDWERKNPLPDEADIFAMKVKLNLPRLNNAEAGLLATNETPYDLLMAGFTDGSHARGMSYTELKDAVNQSRQIAGMTEETTDALKSMQGRSFEFLMDIDGKSIKPIMGYRRPMHQTEWTRDHLFMRQAMYQAHLRDSLMGEAASPFTRELLGALSNDPAFALARKVNELGDDQMRSFIPGFQHAAPQTTEASFLGALVSRERRDVDNIGMLAASKVQRLKTRMVGAIVKDIFTRNMGDAISVLNSTRNARSLMLVNQHLSHRAGWEIGAKPVERTLADGSTGYAFQLDHLSKSNQERFLESFGTPLVEGTLMRSPRGVDMVVDQLGLETLAKMQKVHEETLLAKNTLLRSQGLPEIKSVPWYAPPGNLKGKYVSYTQDMNNNTISDMTMVADSPQQLAKLEDELVKSSRWKPTYRIRSQQSVESFMTHFDKAQMEFMAPNTTAIQPGKSAFGRTGGPEINTQAFGEAMISMQDSLMRHGDEVLDTVFDAPIKAAKARAQIARVQKGIGRNKDAQHASIYDKYLQNLQGHSSLGAKDSFFGDAASLTEQRINGFLNSSPAEKAKDKWGAFTDYLRTASPWTPVRGESFDKFAKELGQYMPYQNIQHMIERETQSRTPTEIANITSKLSWFEAAKRLRWMETAHGLVNFGSILANTPSVVRALQPRRGETLAEAGLRNSSLSMTLRTGQDGSGVVLPNVFKLMHQGMLDAWKKVPDEFTTRGVRRGFMDQDVAEFDRQWGAIDSKAGLKGFLFGDATREGDGFGSKLARSGGIDYWLGFMSDRSERFSRQWGMYMGKRVAESMGMTNVDEQLSLADDLTNKLIANYDPRNRPEVFQGALGAPFGLFQSYVRNYYERMFRYVETKDAQALVSQGIAQSAMFGMDSLPGWGAVNWAFGDRGQAQNEDPVRSMESRLGTDTSDWLMHGTLSSLPKLFGADGVALYTRGDAEFRMPVNPLGIIAGDGLVNIPVTDTISRVYGAISQVASAFQANNGISGTQLAEVLSNAITNRPLAGLIETLGADGFDTDRSGQVVAESLGLENVYRALGVRSMRQQKSIEQFYATKEADEDQAARRSTLNQASRSAVRAGNFKELPGLFAKYVEQGGDGSRYSTWLKTTFSYAKDSKSQRLLKEAMNDKDNSKVAYIARLLDGQVDIMDEDSDDEDYGRQEMIDQLIEEGWESTQEPDDPLDGGL